MFTVSWMTRTHPEGREDLYSDEDHYHRIADLDEARRLYRQVRKRADTYTASLGIEIESTDPT